MLHKTWIADTKKETRNYLLDDSQSSHHKRIVLYCSIELESKAVFRPYKIGSIGHFPGTDILIESRSIAKHATLTEREKQEIIR